ncbi:hypothetical protein ACFX12_030520 [Malus domestica]
MAPQCGQGENRKIFTLFSNAKMERWFEHCNNSLEILLVQEDDFSFSACLARAFGYATNMVATSLESQGTVFKYVIRWQNTGVVGHIWKN